MDSQDYFIDEELGLAFNSKLDAIKHYKQELMKCRAQVASPEEKSSNSIGELPQIGPHESVSLTQLQRHSKAMLHLLYEQSHQIKDLQQTTKFLAEQVKTLVDALAEEQEDPDRPITSYMSGKPV